MLNNEREKIILEELNRQSSITVNEMVEKTGISESTIRRDFKRLIHSGTAIPIYGGIAVNEERNALELPKIADMDAAIVKDRLCKAAAAEVEDGMRIYVDGGTTYRTMMRHLKDKRVTVVTNNVLMTMYHQPSDKNRAEIIALGGVYDPTFWLTTGPITLEKIAQFQFDCAFIAVESISVANNGVYVADIYLASVKQAAMNLSSKVFLTAEHRKLSVRGLYRFAELTDFTKLFIDKADDLPAFPIPVQEVE